MFSLQDQHALVQIVYDSLQEVVPTLTRNAGWIDLIGSAIKRRVISFDPRIECAYGKGRERSSDEREWLFDFLAGLWEPSDRTQERYLMQTIIVGEIECHSSLDKDFDKLLIADPLVAFFVFPDSIKPKHEDDLEFFHEVAKKRVDRAARRGVTPLPAFITARRSANEGVFTYRFAATPHGWTVKAPH